MKHQIRYLQNLFNDLLDDYGQVYLVVKYSENSVIGQRGYTADEKEKGIVLVFNQRNCKNLQWTDDGSIIATLGFGINNRAEKCFLHRDDIVSVFTPGAKVRLERWDMWDTEDQNESNTSADPEALNPPDTREAKVVSLDHFKQKKIVNPSGKGD
jgi:hypothetical protein